MVGLGVLSLTPSFLNYPKPFVSIVHACVCAQSPGPSVHAISQEGILKWVAISFSRGSSQPRDRNHVSCLRKQILYRCATWDSYLYPQKTHLTEASYAGARGVKSLQTTSSNVLIVYNFSFSLYCFLFFNLPLEDLLSSSEPNNAKKKKWESLFFFFSSRKPFHFGRAHGCSFSIW